MHNTSWLLIVVDILVHIIDEVERPWVWDCKISERQVVHLWHLGYDGEQHFMRDEIDSIYFELLYEGEVHVVQDGLQCHVVYMMASKV